MTATEYSKRLGPITPSQFQAALDHFQLGEFVSAEAIPFGLFGQNVFLTSTTGEYVLRGAAHYDWQFPEEQFVAKVLHEQTGVPVPWPYLVDTDDSIFGWKYGYVIMPRMPGLQLADEAVVKALSHDDRTKIAFALGENLREVQAATWPSAGLYDLATRTIKPFEDGFAAWITTELWQWFKKSNETTPEDDKWLEELIKESREALQVQVSSVLVLQDYKEGNLTVQKQDNGDWKVTGVFDLMEALFGDGELDLARQLTAYMEKDMHVAKAFLEGYRGKAPLRPKARERLRLYIAYDRMIVWEYFHRPEHMHMWWYEETSLREWVKTYIDKLAWVGIA